MHPQVIIKILFCGEFLPLGDQKKVWQIQQKDFLELKKNHHISRKKS
jgi:hypothetical protein